MRHWSLKGAIERVIQRSRIRENQAAVAKTKFHGKHLVIAAGFPAMRKLPFPIQRLIGTEIVQAEELDRQSYPIHPQGDELFRVSVRRSEIRQVQNRGFSPNLPP